MNSVIPLDIKMLYQATNFLISATYTRSRSKLGNTSAKYSRNCSGAVSYTHLMEEMPDIRKTGKRITYPKFARIDNASIKELARRVGDVSGFSAGDIEGVLLQTAIEMAHLMAEGRSVKINGIGTFTPSLTLGRDKEREDAEEGGKHRNAQSIFIGDVYKRQHQTHI